MTLYICEPYYLKYAKHGCKISGMLRRCTKILVYHKKINRVRKG